MQWPSVMHGSLWFASWAAGTPQHGCEHTNWYSVGCGVGQVCRMSRQAMCSPYTYHPWCLLKAGGLPPFPPPLPPGPSQTLALPTSLPAASLCHCLHSTGQTLTYMYTGSWRGLQPSWMYVLTLPLHSGGQTHPLIAGEQLLGLMGWVLAELFLIAFHDHQREPYSKQ